MKYQFLSQAAKERARRWWKECEGQEWDGSDHYEDMAECLKFLGITVGECSPHGRTQRGGYDFEWSGFWSQGDGLVFQGTWAATGVDMTGLAEYASVDETLKRIAIQMTAVMLRHPTSTADITTVSYGPGLPGMHVGAFIGEDELGDNIDMTDDAIDVLRAQIAAAAHWAYKQLEADYDYCTSDEYAADNIKANDYDFDRDGDIKRQRVASNKVSTGATV